ncbi:MAG: GatB/YqeY domain-containing protein [Tunicatimonas sp.]
MSLKQRIETDIKQAMRAKDQDSLRTLRSLKSMILLAETEKGAEGALSEEAEMRLLTKAAKQRKESLEVFQEQGRDDLATKEQAEWEVINRYLPQPLSEEDLQQAVEEIVREENANGMQDMGKVMGRATTALAGKADGKAISNVVKQILTRK